MPPRTSRATSTRSDEAGTGLIGSVVGVTVFLVLLLFGAQLALDLYATSAVTGVAFDAAREVATSGSTEAAEASARSVLGRFETGGGHLDFDWHLSDPDLVAVTVRAERPSLLPNLRLPFQRIERTVRVRRERMR